VVCRLYVMFNSNNALPEVPHIQGQQYNLPSWNTYISMNSFLEKNLAKSLPLGYMVRRDEDVKTCKSKCGVASRDCNDNVYRCLVGWYE
jgi:hypothetical protein